MGFLSNFAGKFGYSKSKHRKRAFAGAGTGRLVHSWNPANLSADGELRYSLQRLRARSRDLSVNNPYVKKFFGMVTTNILGPSGINFQSKLKFKNGTFDEKTNDLIETLWYEWGRKSNSPDATGKFSWYAIQKMALRAAARDGEALTRSVRGFQNPYNFALQMIEADHLDESRNVDLGNGRKISMGVEINEWSRPLAYWLSKYHPGETHLTTYSYQSPERVSATEINHLFAPLRVNQTRGVPWPYAAMAKTNILDGYEEAELVNARVSAQKLGIITSPDGEASADDEDEDGQQYDNSEPGEFIKLPVGTSFDTFDPQHPSGNFAPFVKQNLRSIASGLEVAYNSLSSDLESVNFSSIRSGTLEERDMWKALQQWFIEEFCEPVFRSWAEVQLLYGRIPLPLSGLDQICSAAAWKGRTWAWVDPLKDVKASVEALDAGLATMTDILAEQGKDFEEHIEMLKDEKEKIKAAGLSFGNNKDKAGLDNAVEDQNKEEQEKEKKQQKFLQAI